MDSLVMDRNPRIPTLRALALRLCVMNANNFVSLGDLPCILVKPILEACSATNLAQLEDQSPHLREDTQDLWQRHVAERFKQAYQKRENEDWRGLYDRLKFEESERLREATARLRAKNGKLKEEKLAKQIVVIDPKKTPVKGERKRLVPFGSHMDPPKKKNSLMEKARRDASHSQLKYAAPPRFVSSRPLAGPIRPIGHRQGQINPVTKRREPAPPNDNTVFGAKPANTTMKNSFFEALRK